jgi:organic hydroperoxide reductase OsmC/OhrA
MKSERRIVSGTWFGGFKGQGAVALNDVTVTTTLGQAYGAAAQGVTPDELLVGANVSCLLITLGIILERQKLQYSKLHGSGFLTKSASVPPMITQMSLTLSVESTEDVAVLVAAAHEAKEKCTIGRAMSANVDVSLVCNVRRPGEIQLRGVSHEVFAV